MKSMRATMVRAILALLAILLPAIALAACSDEPPQPPGGPQRSAAAGQDGGAPPPAQPPPAPGAPQAALLGDGGAPDAAASLPPLPMREFQERDFAETDQSRDPFRSFASLFVAQAATKILAQRKVLVDHYALDELKLVGIVTRTQPRALLTDPNGLGHIAKVGDFVGKAELVHAGGPTGTDVALNWRVDRIREGDVVFIREDPSHPDIPPTTRVIALRTPEENAALKASIGSTD